MSFERWPAISGSTYTVGITASSSAHVKGAYASLADATGINSARWWLYSMTATANRNYLIDVALGAAGSESVIVANVFLINPRGTSVMVTAAPLPSYVDIPSGSRIAARLQSSVASGSVDVSVLLEQTPLRGLALPATYGVSTSTTTGTTVDPGGTANTKGSYAELSSATAAASTGAVIVTQTPAAGTAFAKWAMDIAMGAAGLESVIVPNLPYQSDDLFPAFQPNGQRVEVEIGASVRIAARAQCTGTSSGTRTLRVCMILDTVPTAGAGVNRAALPSGLSALG